MSAFLRFLVRRLFSMAFSFAAITMVLYAGVMLTPPVARARLYLPPGKGGERASEALINLLIKTHHLDESFLVQYAEWSRSLVTGSWGYSPTLKEEVLSALLRRTPATLELAFYSLLLLIPMGVTGGLLAGWRPGGFFDSLFRFSTFLGTSMPSFLFSMFLLSIFYIRLGWFAPGRIDPLTDMELTRSGFTHFTGALSLDCLLNGRFDIFFQSLRHLAMPVITLSMFHWATLGRITRTSVLGERRKEYIIAARARGVKERRLIWRHALRTILAPVLTTVALSAASIMTSVFVVEIIFDLHGISEVIVISMRSFPDAPAALGFAVYSVIMVMSLMLILDVIQAMLDPRVRQEVLKA
jgi:peptide/nickel transport system permease protein